MRVFRRVMLGGGIDVDTLPDTQKLYYQATAKVTPKGGSLGAGVIANKWDATTGEGIIVCTSDIIKIGNRAFEYCSSLTSVTIPNSVTTIGERVFFGCTGLTSVTIPDNVTRIESIAFQDCRNITNVYISDIAAWCNISFTAERSNPLCYGASLHLNNELVTDLIIPDSVTKIGNLVFFGCGSLVSVTIHNSVTSIGGAFYGCDSLTSVYCKATTPPALGSKNAFLYNGSGRKIYVPMESVEAYKSATNWSEYAYAIEGYEF